MKSFWNPSPAFRVIVVPYCFLSGLVSALAAAIHSSMVVGGWSPAASRRSFR